MVGFELTVWTVVRGNHIYKESWAPAVGEEVRKFLLMWWRFVTLATADADYITTVREMGSIAQPWRPWIWQVRLGYTQSTLWSMVHGTGREKTGNPQLHSFRVSSLLSSQQWGARLKPWYMLASCRLYIPHKKTTNKEERLRCNERPSFVVKYWNGELLERCVKYLKPEIRQQLECIWTGF